MDLRTLRLRRNWCQSELARQIGTTRERVNLWEKGQEPIPREVEQILEKLWIESEGSWLEIHAENGEKDPSH